MASSNRFRKSQNVEWAWGTGTGSGKVVERFPQLLGLGRIDQRDAAQDFGREIGQAGEADLVFLR